MLTPFYWFRVLGLRGLGFLDRRFASGRLFALLASE